MIIAIYQNGSYECISAHSVDEIKKDVTLSGLIDTERKKEYNLTTNEWRDLVYRTN